MHGDRTYNKQKYSSHYLSGGQKSFWEYLRKDFFGYVCRMLRFWSPGVYLSFCQHWRKYPHTLGSSFFINTVMLVSVIIKVHAVCYDSKKSQATHCFLRQNPLFHGFLRNVNHLALGESFWSVVSAHWPVQLIYGHMNSFLNFWLSAIGVLKQSSRFWVRLLLL